MRARRSSPFDFPHIAVASNVWSVPAGTPARFTTAATAFTPTSQWFWQWNGTGGTVNVSSCLGQPQCDYAPPGSGYMLVGVTDAEDFLYMGQSEPVVIPCPPAGDSLIDRPDWKAKVDTLLQKSILASGVSQRQEWGFQGLRDTVSNTVSLGPIQFSGTACSIAIPVTHATHEVDYLIHSHPHFKGENMALAGCGNAFSGRYDPKANGGGSNRDWISYRASGRPVYAVGPEWIHRLDNPDSTQWKYNTKRYRRQSNGCWRHQP